MNDVFDKFVKFAEGFTDSPMMEVNMAFRDVAKATYSTATSHINDKEKLAKIKDILARSVGEIDGLGKAQSLGGIYAPLGGTIDCKAGRRFSATLFVCDRPMPSASSRGYPPTLNVRTQRPAGRAQ